MTVNIELTSEQEACLTAVARREGLDLAEVVMKLIVEHLPPTPQAEEPDPTLALFAQWDEPVTVHIGGPLEQHHAMTTALVRLQAQMSAGELVSPVEGGSLPLPRIITDQGERATRRILEFFAANIRNWFTISRPRMHEFADLTLTRMLMIVNRHLFS